MVAPINYSGLLTQIDLSPLRDGIRLGQQQQAMRAETQDRQQGRQLAQAKFDYDQRKDFEYKAAVEKYLSADAATAPRELLNLQLRFPEQTARMGDAAKSYKASQQQDIVQAGVGAIGALTAGNKDLATKILQDRVTALQNDGVDTSHTQAAIDMIKAGNVDGARNYLSYAVAGLTGPEQMANILDGFGIGAKADARRIDNERQANQQKETERHNRAMEAQGADRVALSRQAGARAAAKAAGGGKRKLPTGFVLD